MVGVEADGDVASSSEGKNTGPQPQHDEAGSNNDGAKPDANTTHENSANKDHSSSEVDDDDEDEIEEEQLEEYEEMIAQLGSFPDKVTINSLSMVAEDHNDSKKSAAALYNCIRKPLVSSSVPRDRKLPLVYVIDSILKNVKGTFLPIIEEDAKTWIPIVFDVLSDEQRQKLRKVWNIWKDIGIFSEASWKEMGSCFLNADAKISSAKVAADAQTTAAGIVRAPDGALKLPTALRKQMQILLDEAHAGVSELDKVSLERLADINPGLLVEIKKAAEDMLSSGQSGSNGQNHGSSQMPLTSSFFMDTRPPEVIARSKAWDNLNLNHLEQSHDLIGKLQHYVRVDSSASEKYSQSEASSMTNLFAAAAATATHLTNALQRLKDQEDNKENKQKSYTGPSGQLYGAGNGAPAKQFLAIDKSLFTNDGIKTKNDTVIGALYEVGLPFVSSSDGRRFGTQIALSNHLDELFKKSQLEKSMERTEERGWYVSDAAWTGEGKAAEIGVGVGVESTEPATGATAEEEADPSTFTVPADESRDRCVICGINFKMFFDHDDGIYKYNNCREIEVLNDDAAEKESESMLVHVTCWRGLGLPEVLTMDQALQDRKY